MTSTLKAIMKEIDSHLIIEDEKREKAIRECREIIRKSAALIMACHKGDPIRQLRSAWSDIRNRLHALNVELKDSPDLYHSGFVENAQAEGVEAAVVVTLFINEGLNEANIFPEPEELGVEERAYLKGLGDVIGN